MVLVDWKSIQDIAEDILYTKEDDIADATIIRKIIGNGDWRRGAARKKTAVEVETVTVTTDRFQQPASLPYQHNLHTNYNNNLQQQQQQQVVDNHCIADNNSKINGNGRINGRHDYIARKKTAFEVETVTVTTDRFQQPASLPYQHNLHTNYNNNPHQQQVVDNHCIVNDRHNYKTAAFFYSRADQDHYLTCYLTCLYNLLQTSDEETKTRATTKPIIAWTPDGLSFRVFTEHHEETAIINLFQAHHFKFGKYQSFIQQITMMYNFKRIATGCYTHPLFQRDRPELFSKITLQKFQQAARNSNRHRIDVLLQELEQAARPHPRQFPHGRPGTVYYGCTGGPIAVTRDGTLCQNCSMSIIGKLCSQHAHLGGDHKEGTPPARPPPLQQQQQQQQSKTAATVARTTTTTMVAVAAAASTKKRTAEPSLDEDPSKKTPSRSTTSHTSTRSIAIAAAGVVIPRHHDIICGHGSNWNKNPGSVWYRTLIERYTKENPVLVEHGKTDLAELIFQTIRAPLEEEEDSSSSNSRRRRFLRRSMATGRWYEISEDEAKDKIRQALCVAELKTTRQQHAMRCSSRPVLQRSRPELVSQKSRNDCEHTATNSSSTNRSHALNSTTVARTTTTTTAAVAAVENRWLRGQRKWKTQYDRLVAYKKKHQSTCVPQSYPADLQLGEWVSRQRKNYKHKKLSLVRINQLNGIGFVWDPSTIQWNIMYKRLVDYKQEHNSTCVPLRYKPDPQLGRWVSWQRTNYNNPHKGMSAERINQLNSLGFVWYKFNKKRKR